MERCPHCRAVVAGNAARCPACGKDVPFEDEVEAIPLDSEGRDERPGRRRRGGKEPDPAPGGPMSRWGFWAALVTFVVWAVGFPLLSLTVDNKDRLELPARVLVLVMGGVLAGGAFAVVAWLLFEVLQNVCGALFGRRKSIKMDQDGARRPWVGAACLGLLLGFPAVAGAVGFCIDPVDRGVGMVLGGLCVGFPLGLGSAGVLLLIVRNT